MKPVIKKVTRKFLLDLARRIYDPKTKKHLRLCTGTLRNGPDPIDKKRTMHCGLGELYVAMTGNEPGPYIQEQDVVDMCGEQTCLKAFADRRMAEAVKSVKALRLPKDVEIAMLEVIDENEEEFSDELESFKAVIDEVPDVNDEEGLDERTLTGGHDYLVRAKAVAAQFQKAAALLPQ